VGKTASHAEYTVSEVTGLFQTINNRLAKLKPGEGIADIDPRWAKMPLVGRDDGKSMS
jgi:hypothetical protein